MDIRIHYSPVQTRALALHYAKFVYSALSPCHSVANFSLAEQIESLTNKIQLPEGRGDICRFCHNRFFKNPVMLIRVQVKMRLKQT